MTRHRFASIILSGVSLLSALVCWGAVNAHSQQSVTTLQPNIPLERELKGGEAHLYVVALAAGQYLQVEVEQRGIDVIVEVLAPNREKLFEFKGEDWLWAKESVAVIAEQTGSYYVQVRPFFAEPKPAPYGVQIKALRAATAVDRERLAIQQQYLAAYQLFYQMIDGRQQTTRENQQKAVAILTAALQSSQRIGDQELEVWLLHELAIRYAFNLHDQPKALAYYEQALQLQRARGERRQQAKIFYEMGFAYTEIGQMPQAREAFQQGLVIFRELGDQGGAGKILNLLGDTYTRESLRTTLDSYLQAAPLLQAAGDIQFEADVRSSMGLVWLLLGEPQQAFAALNRALVLTPLLPWADPKAVALDNLSKVHHAVGDYQKALDTQYEALALRQSIGSTEGAANSLHYLAVTYLELGETQRAVEFFQQSIKLRQELGYQFRTLRSQSEMGIAYKLLGQHQNALAHFQNLLPLTRQYNDKFSEGRTLEGLGLTYQALGEHRKASEFYEQALAVMRALQWQAGESRVVLADGQAHAALGELPRATELYGQALALARKFNQPYVEAEALSSSARAELQRGNLTAARTLLEAALKIIESARSRVASLALRASFLATQHSAYETYVALLMQLHRQDPTAGHAAAALQIAERARARSLTESLTEAPADIRAGVAPTLLARERELRQKLNAKSSAQNRAAAQTAEQAATFSREITELTAELEQVEAQIRAASPRYAALTQPPPLSLAALQQDVIADGDTLLLEYALGEERSFLWAVTKDALTSYELPPRAEIERAARRVYELLTARSQFNKFEEEAARRTRLAKADAGFASAAAELSKLILAPAAAQLGKKRLLIVADGALQYVPFAALPEVADSRNTQPLLSNHELVSLPSAATLAVLHRELAGRQPAPQTVAVLGDPVFDKQDTRVQATLAKTNAPTAEPIRKQAAWLNELERSARDVNEAERAGFDRLPATRAEAQAAVKFAPAGTSRLALDFAANQNTATGGELSRYRYVHFATHGLLNNEHPELSGLVLSLVDEAGRETDGFLPLLEIYNLKLPAELVVLSACKTGIGKEIKGEGLISLTRGFMYAGAARTLVSLWGVNDRSTTALMAQFYQGVLQDKLAPAAALRKAQLALRQDARWAAPYYWAAFTLYGEPH